MGFSLHLVRYPAARIRADVYHKLEVRVQSIGQSIGQGIGKGVVRKRRVLVVDDEETIGIGISEILKDTGFDAAYVINGKDAIETVRKSPFDLIFMDMIMPGMNGLDTYREIRKITPQANVVLFTGYFRDAEEVIVQGVKEGMIDEFIRKPYFAEEIIKSARKYA
ncbi:MAG: response regulator [Deltaproteobacteria bacterium]